MTDDINLVEMGRAIAAHLPDAWRFDGLYEPNSDCRGDWRDVQLINKYKPGARLRICRNVWENQRDRLAISGMLPRTRYINRVQSKARITVAVTRSPRAIAGDIERRLIADYLVEWEAAQKAAEQIKAQQETIAHQLHLVRRFFPNIHARYGHDVKPDDTEFYITPGFFRIWNDMPTRQVSVEFHMNFDQFIRVLGVLAADQEGKSK